MLYVIFNRDGSIKQLIVGESIQQGDHLTKQIFVSIDNFPYQEYTCSADFELPNGTISELVGAEDDQLIAGERYYGYSVYLTQAQTYLAGNVKISLKLIDLNGKVLCTYQFTTKINPTGYNPNETYITEAQYNSLLQAINTRYVAPPYFYEDPTTWLNAAKISEVYAHFKEQGTNLGVINYNGKRYFCEINYNEETGYYSIKMWTGHDFYRLDTTGGNTTLSSVVTPINRKIYVFSDDLEAIAFSGSWYDLNNVPTTIMYIDTDQDITGTKNFADLRIGNFDPEYGYASYGRLGLYNEDKQDYDYLYGGSDGGDYQFPWFDCSLGVDEDLWVQGHITAFDSMFYQGMYDLYEIEFPEKSGTFALTNDIPTKTSDLTNDGNGTASDPFTTKSYVDNIASGSLHFKGTVANVGSLPASGNVQGDMWWVTSENSYYIWNGTAWSQAGGSVDLSGYAKLTGILPRYRQIASSTTLADLYTTVGTNDPFIIRVTESSDIRGYYLCTLSQATVGTTMSFQFQRLDSFENGLFTGSGVSNGTTIKTILDDPYGAPPVGYFKKYGPSDYIKSQGSAPGIPLTFNTSNTNPTQTNRLNIEANFFATNFTTPNKVKAQTVETDFLDSKLDFTHLYFNNNANRIAFATYSNGQTYNLSIHSQVYNSLSGYPDQYVVDLPLKSGTVALLSDIASISGGMREITKGSSDTFTQADIDDLIQHKAYFKYNQGATYSYLMAVASPAATGNTVVLVGTINEWSQWRLEINTSNGTWTIERKNLNLIREIGNYNNSTTLVTITQTLKSENAATVFSYTDSNGNYSGRYLFSNHTTGFNTSDFAIVDLARGYCYSGTFNSSETLGNIIAGTSSSYYTGASVSGGTQLYRHKMQVTLNSLTAKNVADSTDVLTLNRPTLRIEFITLSVTQMSYTNSNGFTDSDKVLSYQSEQVLKLTKSETTDIYQISSSIIQNDGKIYKVTGLGAPLSVTDTVTPM